MRLRGYPVAVNGEAIAIDPQAGHCREPSRREGCEASTTREPEDLLKHWCDRESDGKGFRWTLGVCRNPFFVFDTLTKGESMTKQSKKAVIAYRKTCPAKGTGLSHYILMDKKAK